MSEPPAVPTRLLTPAFALIVASGLAYFLALAMLNPVIPLYVDRRLGGGGLQVGLAVGAFAAGAVVFRPLAGRVGDRRGRRVLLIGGAATVAAMTALYGLVASLGWLLATRFGAGIGEAAFFVGATTMVTDRAPAERRGEAVSYWSVAVYGGLAFGPYLGEVVLGSQDRRFAACWLVSAALAGVAMLLGLGTREAPGRPVPGRSDAPLLHPAAVGPGVVLFLGLISLAGWGSFVKLYATDVLGLHNVGGIFLLYGVLILLVRVLGARLPDTLGPVRAGTGALAFGGAGVAIIAVWSSTAGLVLGTAVFALGMSLLYPALLLLALSQAPDEERSAVVGTFSTFFDLSQGIGGVITGAAKTLVGFRGAFGVGALTAVAGLVVLRGRPAGARVRSAPDATRNPGRMPSPGAEPPEAQS